MLLVQLAQRVGLDLTGVRKVLFWSVSPTGLAGLPTEPVSLTEGLQRLHNPEPPESGTTNLTTNVATGS